ncbi:MAG: SRPBCC family protein [Nanoarchaeota archaeon]|nr:SRPBCC family protein [Nanoarchaeota archaeon]
MKTIKQKIKFKVLPHVVYEALMDSKKHSAFTDSDAKISRKIGGKISAYDGWIKGENIELIKDKKIVQKWRGGDWPEGIYSIATFELIKTENGCELIFTQTEVPDEFYEDVSEGWKEYYWEKMKRYFSI